MPTNYGPQEPNAVEMPAKTSLWDALQPNTSSTGQLGMLFDGLKDMPQVAMAGFNHLMTPKPDGITQLPQALAGPQK